MLIDKCSEVFNGKQRQTLNYLKLLSHRKWRFSCVELFTIDGYFNVLLFIHQEICLPLRTHLFQNFRILALVSCNYNQCSWLKIIVLGKLHWVHCLVDFRNKLILYYFNMRLQQPIQPSFPTSNRLTDNCFINFS